MDGNTTVSRLDYTPSVAENGKSLKCRAENPSLPGSVIENFLTLEVSCKYQVQGWPDATPYLTGV